MKHSPPQRLARGGALGGKGGLAAPKAQRAPLRRRVNMKGSYITITNHFQAFPRLY